MPFRLKPRVLPNSQVPSAELTARQTLRIDVTLGIKSQSVSVEVSDTVAVINTENAALSDSKDNQQITQLPLNNRATTTSPLGALAVSPNVQQDSSGNIALGGASSVDGEFFGRWHLDGERAAEWRTCRMLIRRRREFPR